MYHQYQRAILRVTFSYYEFNWSKTTYLQIACWIACTEKVYCNQRAPNWKVGRAKISSSFPDDPVLNSFYLHHHQKTKTKTKSFIQFQEFQEHHQNLRKKLRQWLRVSTMQKSQVVSLMTPSSIPTIIIKIKQLRHKSSLKHWYYPAGVSYWYPQGIMFYAMAKSGYQTGIILKTSRNPSYWNQAAFKNWFLFSL